MSANLLIVPLLAALAPLLTRVIGRWFAVPIVVFELVLGILVGPSVLAWVEPIEFLATLAQFGLAMLFFVAGSELDFAAFRGRTGRNAAVVWLLSLGIGILIGLLVGPLGAAIIIGIALSSTALGTILPILRDAGELKTPFGKAVAAVGAVGEFGPLVAISVFLGGRDPGVASIVLAAFLLIAGLAIWLAFRIPHGMMHRVVSATLHTSGQYAIRVVFLILGALLALSITLDLDILLGAFTAGIVWQLMMRDASEENREAVESKIEGIAFGFLVPIFFIYTGVTFDLAALLADPMLLLFVPVVLIALLVVRGIPSMFVAPPGATVRDRLALGLLGATGLPIIVAVTAIGVDENLLTSAQAALFVTGGMLSVLLYPLIGMMLRGERVSRVPAELDDAV